MPLLDLLRQWKFANTHKKKASKVVLSVAMIAIARHAIDVDYKTIPPLGMVGMGSVIVALAIGYFYFKKADLLKAAARNQDVEG